MTFISYSVSCDLLWAVPTLEGMTCASPLPCVPRMCPAGGAFTEQDGGEVCQLLWHMHHRQSVLETQPPVNALVSLGGGKTRERFRAGHGEGGFCWSSLPLCWTVPGTPVPDAAQRGSQLGASPASTGVFSGRRRNAVPPLPFSGAYYRSAAALP